MARPVDPDRKSYETDMKPAATRKSPVWKSLIEAEKRYEKRIDKISLRMPEGWLDKMREHMEKHDSALDPDDPERYGSLNRMLQRFIRDNIPDLPE